MNEEKGLAETFGPPALANLLTRRTPAPASPPTTAPGPADSTPDASASQVKTSSEERPTRRRRTAPPSARRESPAAVPAESADPVGDVTSQVSVYVLPELLQAVRRTRANDRGRTNADIAFEAIDATHRKLAEIVAARHGRAGRPGSLFPTRRTGRSTEPTRRVLWSMKATPAELAVVDRLVTETGAVSRSELIATAMEAHLLPRRPGDH